MNLMCYLLEGKSAEPVSAYILMDDQGAKSLILGKSNLGPK